MSAIGPYFSVAMNRVRRAMQLPLFVASGAGSAALNALCFLDL